MLEIPNPDGRNLDVVADKWENDPKLLQKKRKAEASDEYVVCGYGEQRRQYVFDIG